MQSFAICLILVAPIFVSGKVPGCIEGSNPGVLNTFGPLATNLRLTDQYSQQYQSGTALAKYQLQGVTEKYLLQYQEFSTYGTETVGYFRVYYNDNGIFKTLDHVRVNTRKWNDIEDAIMDADHFPSPDSKVRVKYLVSDCTCVMRIYDLTSSDIVSQATSVDCTRATALNNPYNLQMVKTDLSNGKKFFIMDADEKYPTCNAARNFGVYKEFGTLHEHLTNIDYFYKVDNTDDSSMKLIGRMTSYKVEYTEYREQRKYGTGIYGYVTVTYKLEGQEKVLDYVRVEPGTWKQIQKAILEGSEEPSTNRKIRVKYLTSSCNCVMRVYNLRESDIAGTAETRACNGVLLTNMPHRLAGDVHQTSDPPLVSAPSNVAKYPGCSPLNNVGVFNEFGPLPKDLTLGNHYRQNVYSNIANKKFQLEGALSNYFVEYYEFEDKFAVGTGMFAYHSLTYNDIHLDNIRVNFLKWNEIENAIISADKYPIDNKISIQFLMSDCSCVTRQYNLKIDDFYFRAKTIPCPPLEPLPPRKSTKLSDKRF